MVAGWTPTESAPLDAGTDRFGVSAEQPGRLADRHPPAAFPGGLPKTVPTFFLDHPAGRPRGRPRGLPREMGRTVPDTAPATRRTGRELPARALARPAERLLGHTWAIPATVGHTEP